MIFTCIQEDKGLRHTVNVFNEKKESIKNRHDFFYFSNIRREGGDIVPELRFACSVL
jgi:hypothetical protein